MIDEMMSLCALLEKPPDADLWREMVDSAAERLMELEVGALTRAAPCEKSPFVHLEVSDSSCKASS